MSRGAGALARAEAGSNRALAFSFEELATAAQGYARASKAEATVRTYRSAWRGFVRWCEIQGLEALPADGATVAFYVTTRAKVGIKPASIDLDLAAIAAAHAAAGHPSPRSSAEVQAVRAGIRRTHGVAQRQAAPILPDDLRAMVAALPDTLAGKRDRALLLLGFATGSRRSELAALQAEDVVFVSRGLEVAVRRSKTDQEGRGHVKPVPFGRFPSVCPVRAVKAWIKAAGLEDGPLFRPINRHGHIAPRALTGHSINRIVKRAARAAGLDAAAISGHSLRAGLVTAAVLAGRTDREIMAQTGHRSAEMLTRYTRKARAWEGAFSLL